MVPLNHEFQKTYHLQLGMDWMSVLTDVDKQVVLDPWINVVPLLLLVVLQLSLSLNFVFLSVTLKVSNRLYRMVELKLKSSLRTRYNELLQTLQVR